MGRYTNTIPNLICEEVTSQCIAQYPNDLAGQSACLEETGIFCGTFGNKVVSLFPVTTTLDSGSVVTSSFNLTFVQQGASSTASIPTAVNSTTTRLTPATSSLTPTTSSLTPATSSTSSSATHTSKSGLSSGAIAAAAVVPVVVVALLALGLGLFIYRKQRAAKVEQPEGWEKAELDAQPVPPTELRQQEVYEIQGEALPREMEANEQPAHEAGLTSPT